MLPPEWTVKNSLFTAGGFVYHKPIYKASSGHYGFCILWADS